MLTRAATTPACVLLIDGEAYLKRAADPDTAD
jgi:hypothetical protein